MTLLGIGYSILDYYYNNNNLPLKSVNKIDNDGNDNNDDEVSC